MRERLFGRRDMPAAPHGGVAVHQTDDGEGAGYRLAVEGREFQRQSIADSGIYSEIAQGADLGGDFSRLLRHAPSGQPDVAEGERLTVRGTKTVQLPLRIGDRTAEIKPAGAFPARVLQDCFGFVGGQVPDGHLLFAVKLLFLPIHGVDCAAADEPHNGQKNHRKHDGGKQQKGGTPPAFQSGERQHKHLLHGMLTSESPPTRPSVRVMIRSEPSAIWRS